MKFIHLTDPHLAAPGRTLFGLDPDARLAAAVDHIARHHADAACAVITGDLADRGEPAAYGLLRRHLDALPFPCHLVAGNHDRREALIAAFPDIPRMDAGFIQYSADAGGGLRFVVLDTVVPGRAHGKLCAKRLGWLDGALAEAGKSPVFLFLHHPPVTLGIPDLDDLRLRQSAELAEVLRRHGNVRHMFFGHVHRPAWGVWQDVPFTTLPSTNHQSALVFERLDGILDSHEPPAYAVVRADANGDVVINPQAYLDDSPRFFISGPRAVDEDASLSQLLTE